MFFKGKRYEERRVYYMDFPIWPVDFVLCIITNIVAVIVFRHGNFDV